MVCGLGKLNTGKKDPFVESCVAHDDFYMVYKHTKSESVRARGDKEFLDSMLVTAGDSKFMRSWAYTYYSLVRILGWVPWYFFK